MDMEMAPTTPTTHSFYVHSDSRGSSKQNYRTRLSVKPYLSRLTGGSGGGVESGEWKKDE
jgi:hypothetical protein